MRLSKKIDYALITIGVILVSAVFYVLAQSIKSDTFADDGDTDYSYTEAKSHFVTIYDGSSKLTIKTDAGTVGDAISRTNILLNDSDSVEPSLDSEINADNFFINIYRSRPVIIQDGTTEIYLMSSSYDPKTIANKAGLSVYDGDEINLIPNEKFLETGIANVYRITRNGGRTITIEEEIPFGEETIKDYGIATGASEVRQLGEVGSKTLVYEVFYVDGVEKDRKLVSEEVTKEPVNRVVAVGAKKSIRPEWSTCASWATEAGVSEADLNIAVDLMYRESGCRVDAQNAYSGAYGIPQALPGSKMASAGGDWETNPVTQIKWMINYVNGRYGGWTGAANWWDAHGWY